MKLNTYMSVINSSILEYNERSKVVNNEMLFLRRVYKNGINNYLNRIKEIGILDNEKVLDAGCGYGQWSLALSTCNNQIYSCDYSFSRINFLKKICNELNIKNINCSKQYVEKLRYENNKFDYIFAYSIILYTDYKKTLTEFKRTLRPGGYLYICCNGLGWYLYNFFSVRNKAKDYDPKIMAINAIENTIGVLNGLNKLSCNELIIPSSVLINDLKELGFKIIHKGHEGSLNIQEINNEQGSSFFIKEYLGKETVYEVLCQLK
jgi:SAM-dependent methyltransferase